MTALRIFVKRGALWRFNRLSRDAEELQVSVEWDRRLADRRAAAAVAPAGERQDEQRKEDRRGAAPYTWDAAEFVVVEDRVPPDPP